MSDDEHIDPSFSKTERLFHYTNSAGLFGILQSSCLWATHYRFLNDSREFYAAQEPLISILSNGIAKAIAAEKVNRGVKFKDGFDLHRVARVEGERLIKEFYDHLLITNPDAIDPFVFSTFSCEKTHPDFENGGLLHWATYGRSGGYAIQINPHKLNKKLKTEGEKYSFAFLSGPAIYDTAHDLSRDFKSASEGIEKFGQSFALNTFLRSKKVDEIIQVVESQVPYVGAPF